MNRYQYIKIEKNLETGVKQYRDSKYPSISLSPTDIYVVTTIGDRYDLLANQYYGDSTLWWIISAANSLLPQNSIFIPVGTQIRIPTDINNILTSYNNLNS
jgi:nucleoid-associated protein YgaU